MAFGGIIQEASASDITPSDYRAKTSKPITKPNSQPAVTLVDEIHNRHANYCFHQPTHDGGATEKDDFFLCVSATTTIRVSSISYWEDDN
mmetsp:Transcript_8110/g.17153  ORF Transcript_8110/g.17153 Transcript_8110/m.17153 type:complete len:90 (+) Transcript_8110:43-312(+)